MRLWTLATPLLLLLAISPAGAQQRPAYDDRPKITVNGEAVVHVQPDKIVITLGIETSDPDISLAKQKNNDILRKAIAAITRCGVPEKEIQTDHLSLEPRYGDDYRRREFLGYFVRNTLVVTLTDPGRLEELVTRVLQAGVNYIHGVDFQTAGFKMHREEARKLALEAAREKAVKMSGVLGQSIGAPIQISETYSGSPWWYSGWSGWGYGRGQGMSQNVIQNVEGGSGEILDTIALGQISIRAGVTVTFELK